MKTEAQTSVVALGGLGEVGKNMYVITHNSEIIIIDAGVMFPEDELLGVDYVIQDVTYLKQNENKIKGLFITHGHEDHIGGISFLLQSVNIPTIYAPKMAVSLISKKLEDKNMSYQNIVTIDKAKEVLDNTDDTVFLISKDIETCLKLVEKGVELPAINVGAVPNEEGRKLITTGVAISQKELDMLEELNSKGIEITVQPMPEISAISFDAVKRKM